MHGKTDEHCIGATINGYDGSLLNGLQTMTPWQDCKYWQRIIIKIFAKTYHLLNKQTLVTLPVADLGFLRQFKI
jgi:hypothetical protein